jgi:hypothetical protein
MCFKFQLQHFLQVHCGLIEFNHHCDCGKEDGWFEKAYWDRTVRLNKIKVKKSKQKPGLPGPEK